MSPFSQLRSLIDLAFEQRTTSVRNQPGSSGDRADPAEPAPDPEAPVSTTAERDPEPARQAEIEEKSPEAPEGDALDPALIGRLQRIVHNGNNRSLEALLANGEIDLSHKLENGETLGVRLLFHAVSSGHQTVTRTLLLHGADPRAPNADGDSAFGVADFMHKQDICNIILRHELEASQAKKAAERKKPPRTAAGSPASTPERPSQSALPGKSSVDEASPSQEAAAEPPPAPLEKDAARNLSVPENRSEPEEPEESKEQQAVPSPEPVGHADVAPVAETSEASPVNPSVSRGSPDFGNLDPDAGLTVDLSEDDEDDPLDAFFGDSRTASAAPPRPEPKPEPEPESESEPEPESESGPESDFESTETPSETADAPHGDGAGPEPHVFEPVSVRMHGGFVADHDSLVRWHLRETDAVTRLRCLERLSELPLEDRLILAFIRIQNRQPIDLDLGIHCGELFRMLKLYGDDLIAAMEAEGSEA